MANDRMLFVAIIGGFWEIRRDPAALEEAKKTAAEFGVAPAKAGMGLVVYFSEQDSLEPHVVSGYVTAIKKGTNGRAIRVRFPESQRNIVTFPEQETRSDLFELNLFAGRDWEAPFYRSLVAGDGVDSVLLMAGGRSTLIAGQIALARPLPILAIDKFDGAAAVIRTELATHNRDYPSLATHSVTELVAWLKQESMQRASEQAHTRRKETAYIKSSSQMSKTMWATVAFSALLCTIFCGITDSVNASLYPFIMFLSLIAAGATGALVRSLIWDADGVPPATSLLLGGVAGFVVGISYLIPQWIGAPGVLAPSVGAVNATDKIRFVSASLVAISAGVGFDTVFSRLRKQADQHTDFSPAHDRTKRSSTV